MCNDTPTERFVKNYLSIAEKLNYSIKADGYKNEGILGMNFSPNYLLPADNPQFGKNFGFDGGFEFAQEGLLWSCFSISYLIFISKYFMFFRQLQTQGQDDFSLCLHTATFPLFYAVNGPYR